MNTSQSDSDAAPTSPANPGTGPGASPENGSSADGRIGEMGHRAAPLPGADPSSESSTAGDDRFTLAVQRLMRRAPGPVFPRARRLYFDKYALEDREAATSHRTHLLEESIVEGSDGSLRIEIQAFALVPWDPERGEAASGGPADPSEGERYLWEQWQRRAMAIAAVPGPWFRTTTGFLRVALVATHCSGGGEDSDLRPAGN